MGLLGALLIGWLLWLGVTGRIARPNRNQIIALVATLVGGVLAVRGRPLVGGGMAVAALAWLSRIPVRRDKPAPGAPDLPADIYADSRAREALELLGLDATARRSDVIEAHRRLIARVHPDTGGTEALARNLNQARDYLLQRLP